MIARINLPRSLDDRSSDKLIEDRERVRDHICRDPYVVRSAVYFVSTNKEAMTGGNEGWRTMDKDKDVRMRLGVDHNDNRYVRSSGTNMSNEGASK